MMSCESSQRWLSFLITITFAQSVAIASMLDAGVSVSHSCSGMVQTCSIIDFVLNGYVYNTTATKSHRICIDACEAQPQCHSTNYATRDGNQCELNSVCYDEFLGKLIQKPEWVYTSRKRQVCIYSYFG